MRMKMKKTIFTIILLLIFSKIYGQETIDEINHNDSIILPAYSFSDSGVFQDLIDSLKETSFMEHTYYDIIVGKTKNGVFFEIQDCGVPNAIIDRLLYNKGYYKNCNIVGCILYKGLIMNIINVNITDSCINMFFKREYDKTITLYRKEQPVIHNPIDDTWFVYHHPLFFLYMNGKIVPAEAIRISRKKEN